MKSNIFQEHIFLTPEAKMRNHLAEDILNSDMLHLMELYQNNLGHVIFSVYRYITPRIQE
jgi:hypothetical protein